MERFPTLILFFVIVVPLVFVAGISFEEDVTLSGEQKNALDRFKKIMMPFEPKNKKNGFDDLYLLKWLRYHNFDINQAQHKLLNHLAWRKRNKMDDISREDWSDMERDFKYSIDGRDKYGRSYLYFDVGSLDLRRAILQGKGERIMRYVDKALQEACSLVRDLGHQYKNITRGHLIINLDGYNILEHGCIRCIPYLLRIVSGYESSYPECADKIITVNTPSSVEPLLNAIRPLLSPGMRKSLRIYGTNREKWSEALRKDFEVDQLPPALGGTAHWIAIEEE